MTSNYSPTGRVLGIRATQFTLDAQPFAYSGLSFFNAIYNTAFNAGSSVRQAWMRKFLSFGINVLRVWCQWDSRRGFIDTSPAATMYEMDGTLHAAPLATLKAILADARSVGLCLEIVLFSQECYEDNCRINAPADERAVAAITRELATYRNATFQIWNEHTDARVLHLLKVIKSIDPDRLVSNSPGYSSVLGSDEENAALDYLSPHTSRNGRHWEIAAAELGGLVRKFHKPVVDDEPARNGTKQFGGPEAATSPFDHVVQVLNIRRAGAYPTYHHDMFQTGYGTPPIPPSGIPDPEFNPYHRIVFDFLATQSRYEPLATDIA